MSEKYILISIVVAIIVIIFIVLLLIVKNNNEKVVIVKKTIKKIQKKKKVTIKDMTELAARKNASCDDLKKAIDIVKKDLVFPKKIKYKLPKDIKVYLNFVLLVASHKNADAKLIAYMDRELKKSNPGYTTEIDIYENEGLKERGHRI
ncbi:MAG: hypothetical protein QM482_00650 [Sulfurospirillum sp.]